MKALKGNLLAIIACLGIIISIISAFTTIIGYRNGFGEYKSFSVIDFFNTNEFESFVMKEYTGEVYVNLNISDVRKFAFIGIVAIVCAFCGLALLSQQKSNLLSFILTIMGLIGTMTPAVAIVICIILLRNNYIGQITCGIYPVVSIFTMIISILASTKMYRNNKKYMKKLNAAKDLFYKAGDL